jgi:SOS-response transcriptional repressor LexA
VEPGPELQGKVPIISWVQAGNFATVLDKLHSEGVAVEWAATTVPIHKHTYALRIRGDSMTSPTGEPTFADGQVIIVEPDAVREPEALVGQFVIVKRAGESETTFKQLVKDSGRFYLKPLNPQYPILPLNKADVICGVVRQKVVTFF